MRLTAAGPASAKAVEREGTGSRLKQLFLLGHEPATVAALGRLLGKSFCLLVPDTIEECLTTLSSEVRVDGLVVDPACGADDMSTFLGSLRARQPALPIFAFTASSDVALRHPMAKLGIPQLFRNPADICKLAEAIHTRLGSHEYGRRGRRCRATTNVVARAIEFVENNLRDIDTTADMSRHVSMSREHLSRLFTRYVGCTLWDFVTVCRIDRAKELLRERGLSVKEVSREVGYACESSFFRAFVKHTGLTPSRYGKTPPEGASTETRPARGKTHSARGKAAR